MNTLVRSTTVTFNPRFSGYEPLNQDKDTNHGQQIKETCSKLMNSLSYRRNRAKQRQVFLRTYKLAPIHKLSGSKSQKVKKIAVKVKKFVASMVSFMRIGSLRSSSCKSAIAAASPIPIRKCF
ncbi:Beta-(1--_2)glucan export ATP-binding/permease protein like [Quillaja saponaria]|uniref:Beta-(1-->2)glucan export ATP-binding/permease protein like n=1 Tax=Quillaja saponaria TaxID=32244 RepID=A0AAD7PB18_QUISA|nr:Beta-(1-->2)glucan export ATP-binding/permease protein like [Quillaja saponaria]